MPVVGAVWVGEHGVRYYAHGRPLTTRSDYWKDRLSLSATQGSIWMWCEECISFDSPKRMWRILQRSKLRGTGGKPCPKRVSKGCEGDGRAVERRVYKPDDFSAGDSVNQALSAGHACLYGLAHAVIVALDARRGSDLSCPATSVPLSMILPIFTRRRSPFRLHFRWLPRTRRTCLPLSGGGSGTRW